MSNEETIAELNRQIRAYEATVHNLHLQLEAVGAGGVQALSAPKYQSEHILELVSAAQAVVRRWHSTSWKDAPTADYINRLERAAQQFYATEAIHRRAYSQQTVDALAAQRDELLAALHGMLAIVKDSRGVAGYHLNGDTAEWDEFDEIDIAHTAIAKAEGGAV